MSTKKLETIKKFYSKEYGKCKPDGNGWTLQGRVFLPDTELFKNGFDCETKSTSKFYNGSNIMWRPKSLKGIENNNGWNSMLFKEPPYPEHDVEYWIVTHGITLKAKWNMVRKEFINVHGLQENVTHWQPITKPLPPIY